MSVSETTLLGRNDVKPGKHCICTMHYHVPQHGGWQLCRRAACSACSTSSIESVMIDCPSRPAFRVPLGERRVPSWRSWRILVPKYQAALCRPCRQILPDYL